MSAEFGVHIYATKLGRVLWAMTPEFEEELRALVDRHDPCGDLVDAIRVARTLARSHGGLPAA